jgi:hypothetical protein
MRARDLCRAVPVRAPRRPRIRGGAAACRPEPARVVGASADVVVVTVVTVALSMPHRWLRYSAFAFA